MRNKYFNIKNYWTARFAFLTYIIIVLLFLEHFTLISISIRSNSNSDSEEKIQYPNRILNDTISFSLDPNTYTNEIRLNFTNINETRDFIKNGDFNLGSDGWNALNETDINYKWNNTGPESTKCISINLTGLKSEKLYKPMNNSLGIEDFRELDGWFLTNNDTANFTQKRDDTINKNYPLGIGIGSLMHQYNGDLKSGGKANSTYQFFYNASFVLLSANLSFFYMLKNEDFGPSDPNTIEISVKLTTPDKQDYLIDDWKGIYSEEHEADFFYNKTFPEISHYFNKTGFYNLTFHSKHIHNESDMSTTVWFDYIELNITWGLKKLNNSDLISWNQSIKFNRNAFSNGELNFSYYITKKFEHINNSNAFLSVWVNDHQMVTDSLKNITALSWIKESINVPKSYIGVNEFNVCLGLYFNKTTYISSNETFSIFFNNISFIIGANPTNASQIDLKVHDPQLNKSFNVIRDSYNNDFVRIFNESFTWGSGQIYLLNLTCNSSEVVISCTLTYFVIDKSDKDDNNGTDKPPLILNSTFLVMVLIILLSFSSFLFVDRFEKRFFMNPKYDYIKKLKFKRKMKIQKLDAIVDKKPCISCGRSINLTAKFCEHCGKTQI